jgi:hypothetical protein
MAQRDIFVPLSNLGLCRVVWIPRFESSPLTNTFLNAVYDETGEETLQPIAVGALRDDDNHVRTVDHILGPVRRRHLLVIRAWFSELDPATTP